MAETKIGRICFRGDTRDPDTIFRDGFMSRNMKAEIRYMSTTKHTQKIPIAHAPQYERSGFKKLVRNIYNPVKGVNEADPNFVNVQYSVPGDIANDTAVCVTPRFVMASLFPPTVETRDTWIYVVHVESGFNTHAQQVADGLQAVKREIAARTRAVWENPGSFPPRSMTDFTENSALWPLYAQELATKSIPAKHVIAAIPCQRTWKGKDWTEGARFTLDKSDIRWNRRCKLDRKITEIVRAFLDKEPAQGETPGRGSGFHRSFTDFRDAAEFAS